MSMFGRSKSKQPLPLDMAQPQPAMAGFAMPGGAPLQPFQMPPYPMPVAPGQNQPASMPWSSPNLPGEGMPPQLPMLGDGLVKTLGNNHGAMDFDKIGDVAGKVQDKGQIGSGKRRGGFFSKNGAWRDVLGVLGDSLAQAGGMSNQHGYIATKIERERALRDHNWRIEELRARLNMPKLFNSGNDRVAYDPVTGQANVIYDGVSKAEDYAGALGYEPGTDEYNQAVQDYILRSYGPTATGNRNRAEDHRQGNRVTLEGIRQGNRLQLGRQRIGGQAAIHAQPSYRDLHPVPPKGRSTATSGGQTATDPKTGRKVQWNGTDWVPVN